MCYVDMKNAQKKKRKLCYLLASCGKEKSLIKLYHSHSSNYGYILSKRIMKPEIIAGFSKNNDIPKHYFIEHNLLSINERVTLLYLTMIFGIFGQIVGQNWPT